MHIVLSVLGVIVTILILLNRMNDGGIDIGWLNPFAWKRRKDWAKKYHADPIYSLESPMDVTAVLIVALAKSEGEISSEQKSEVLRKFNEVFHLDDNASASLLRSSTFLLKDNISSIENMQKLMAPSKESFSIEQITSAFSLLKHIASYESPPNSFQKGIIKSFKKYFDSTLNDVPEWS
ncbi:MAG: hypothetical protein OEY06_08965 [Gammaproteobacteria bacterium]|nr:hypothetical protein [Gammaproteobacteria bacterium]